VIDVLDVLRVPSVSGLGVSLFLVLFFHLLRKRELIWNVCEGEAPLKMYQKIKRKVKSKDSAVVCWVAAIYSITSHPWWENHKSGLVHKSHGKIVADIGA